MKLVHRYYELNSLVGIEGFNESIDLLLTGQSKEFRAKKVPSLIKDRFKGETYIVNYDVELEKYLISTYFLTNPFDDLKNRGKDLIPNFLKDMEDIGIDNKTILIDITSIKHPLVFYLILLLRKNFTPKKLFVCYTEPQKYRQIDSEEIGTKFDLTEKFGEVNSLPGYLRGSDYDKEKLLIAILGFEGTRFSKVFGDVNPATRSTYAIIGFPSFHPSWQYYVYSENQSTLEQSKAYDRIMRTTANEPFGVYNILKKIKKTNPNHSITIAPIGTKPHSLGVSMFAVNNEDIQLYYDFPSHGKKIRTIGVGKSLLYNLTDFINE